MTVPSFSVCYCMQGFGMLLMEEAERIARDEHGSHKMAVISGKYSQECLWWNVTVSIRPDTAHCTAATRYFFCFVRGHTRTHTHRDTQTHTQMATSNKYTYIYDINSHSDGIMMAILHNIIIIILVYLSSNNLKSFSVFYCRCWHTELLPQDWLRTGRAVHGERFMNKPYNVENNGPVKASESCSCSIY